MTSALRVLRRARPRAKRGTDPITATYSGDSNIWQLSTLSGGQLSVRRAVSDGWFQPESFDLWPGGKLHGECDSGSTGVGNPTGTVQFTVDGSAFGSPVTLASGSATSGSISTLTEGTHTVTATYSGVRQ